MQLLWCMRERTNFDRGVLSLFLCLRKNYSEMKRNGQGQIKTCRRKQHVKTDGMKGISNLFCGIFAVGGNYNLTRDNQKRYGLIYDAKCIGNRRGFHNVCKAEFTPVAGKTPFD